ANKTYEYPTCYHAIHEFCTIDLSSCYLYVAKDILYIEPENDKRRRSIQTVSYDIIVGLVKLLTPIIPHSAEEIWEHIPHTKEEYVQLTDMPKPKNIMAQDQLDKWNMF